jgi:anti-sigma B factor antagonist
MNCFHHLIDGSREPGVQIRKPHVRYSPGEQRPEIRPVRRARVRVDACRVTASLRGDSFRGGRQVLDERKAKRLSQLCSMRVERHYDTVLISLHGEFDCSCERAFHEEIGCALDEQASGLVLDLHALRFIDSPGLRMLLTLDGTARDDGLDFTVLCRSGAVRRVLKDTGLDGLLPIVDDAGAVPASDSPI